MLSLHVRQTKNKARRGNNAINAFTIRFASVIFKPDIQTMLQIVVLT